LIVSVSFAILFVADFLHPVDDLAAQRLLNGDVRHGARRRSAVPVLFVWREPDHVARADLLDRPAVALDPAGAEGDDQGLAEGMSMPGRARARLEGDGRALSARGLGGGK